MLFEAPLPGIGLLGQGMLMREAKVLAADPGLKGCLVVPGGEHHIGGRRVGRAEDLHTDKARLLVDQSHLTTAYPELIVTGGKGAVIEVGYAESLFGSGSREKGNRNEVEGKMFVGYYDVFISDGGKQRMYRPLWWRTYRYIDLKIETRDEPLTIEDFRGVYVGYPFQFKARFDALAGTQDCRARRIESRIGGGAAP